MAGPSHFLDTPSDTPSDTPIFGDTLGDTPGTLRARRARETPVPGRRDPKICTENVVHELQLLEGPIFLGGRGGILRGGGGIPKVEIENSKAR